jgi:drug/metabolite transporter (DMT)-like permease
MWHSPQLIFSISMNLIIKNQNKMQGRIEVVLSGLCFGLLGYFGKMAYQNHILWGELLALRYLLSALMLAITFILFNKKLFSLGFKNTLISLLLGIFGYALFSSLFFYALTGLSAALTVLLLYTYPIWVFLLSRIILKEEMTSIKLISLIISIIGLYFLVGSEFKIKSPIFLIAGLGAAFFYSLYIIYSRLYLEKISAISSSFYVQLGAGLALFCIHFKNVERPIFILNNHYIFIISMAFICSLLAMTLFLSGLAKISSSETAILSTTEPISGIIIAHFFLHETMSFTQYAGALILILAMILMGLNPKYFDKHPTLSS